MSIIKTEKGSVMNVYGTTGNDTLYGSNTEDDNVYGFSGNDTLYGFGGNDNLSGGGGHDWLLGGTGNDNLYGGQGWDVFYGGSGNDQFVFSGESMTYGDHDYIGDWNSEIINFLNGAFYDYGVYDDNGDQVYDGIRILSSAADDGTADAIIDLIGVGFVGPGPIFSSSWILGGTATELS